MTSFWFLAVLLASFLFAASAPSPLYPLWAAEWQFPASTLTQIYAVYAFGALAALLITGRLSDHVGRRRPVLLAIVVQIAAALTLLEARGVGELYLGRTLQGVATGVASSALSAWLLDLRRPNDPIGGLVGGIAPVAGLAAGALGSALIVEYGPDPIHLVMWVLVGIFAVALAAIPFVPAPRAASPGWLSSLRPVIGVPAPARPTFVALAPSLVAVWALGGLYLALGPSLATAVLASGSHVAGGAVIFALLCPAAVASAALRRADARTLVTNGSLVLLIGVALTLFAVAVGSTVALYAGSVVAGIGFGPAFSGIFRTLVPLAPVDQRAALVASIYVALYLAFSIPTIVAGVAVGSYGLRATTYAYGVIVIVLAATTTYAARVPGPIRPGGAKSAT